MIINSPRGLAPNSRRTENRSLDSQTTSHSTESLVDLGVCRCFVKYKICQFKGLSVTERTHVCVLKESVSSQSSPSSESSRRLRVPVQMPLELLKIHVTMGAKGMRSPVQVRSRTAGFVSRQSCVQLPFMIKDFSCASSTSKLTTQ